MLTIGRKAESCPAMKTTIQIQEEQKPGLPAFPALYRSKESGNIWLAESESCSVLLHSESGTRHVDLDKEQKWPAHTYERLTVPVTITFHP